MNEQAQGYRGARHNPVAEPLRGFRFNGRMAWTLP